MAVGAVMFAILLAAGLLLAEPPGQWAIPGALAEATMDPDALWAAPPPWPAVPSPGVAAAPLRLVDDSVAARRLATPVVLGLAFSLLVAANLAFVRHLLRVHAAPRRRPGRSR